VSKFERVSPEEAQALLADGYVYLDVRSPEEFDAGHVPGAYNVPLRHRGPAGMVDNSEFLAVVTAVFPKDARLLVGCQSGGRSVKAATVLTGAGYGALKELRTGYDGSRDAFGRPDPGWSKKGLPVETAAPPERTYAELRKELG